LADHELDVAFAAALREAQAEAGAALPANSPLRRLHDRIAALMERVDADKKRVEALEKEAGDALDLAQAQRPLDQDALDDAQQDLAREGGDKRARLQRLLQEHEASEKVADQTVKFSTPAATRRGSLFGSPAAAVRAAQIAYRLDQRAQDSKHLATVYQSWSALVESRRHTVLHLMLSSLAAILGILLGAVLLNGAMRYAFRQTDRHRLHQLRMIARITLQVAAVLLIMLISAGPAVSLRPGALGLEVLVRYITRAPQRNVVKAKLLQEVVDLLRKPA